MIRITTAARIAPRITVATTNKLPTAATATSPLQEEGGVVSRLSVDGAVVSTTVTVGVVVAAVLDGGGSGQPMVSPVSTFCM